MEGCNMIIGTSGNEPAPGLSTHLVISEMKLPGIEENFVDLIAGGAPVATEVNTHINRLESTFILDGWQPEVMGCIQTADTTLQQFFAYGAIRERRLGQMCQSKAEMWGRLSRVNPTNFRRGDMLRHEYSIRGITHYELWMSRAGKTKMTQIYYWDFFNSDFRIMSPNGDVMHDANAELREALRIP
jgi:phage tail tube protein FII